MRTLGPGPRHPVAPFVLERGQPMRSVSWPCARPLAHSAHCTCWLLAAPAWPPLGLLRAPHPHTFPPWYRIPPMHHEDTCCEPTTPLQIQLEGSSPPEPEARPRGRSTNCTPTLMSTGGRPPARPAARMMKTAATRSVRVDVVGAMVEAAPIAWKMCGGCEDDVGGCGRGTSGQGGTASLPHSLPSCPIEAPCGEGGDARECSLQLASPAQGWCGGSTW